MLFICLKVVCGINNVVVVVAGFQSIKFEEKKIEAHFSGATDKKDVFCGRKLSFQRIPFFLLLIYSLPFW